MAHASRCFLLRAGFGERILAEAALARIADPVALSIRGIKWRATPQAWSAHGRCGDSARFGCGTAPFPRQSVGAGWRRCVVASTSNHSPTLSGTAYPCAPAAQRRTSRSSQLTAAASSRFAAVFDVEQGLHRERRLRVFIEQNPLHVLGAALIVARTADHDAAPVSEPVPHDRANGMRAITVATGSSPVEAHRERRAGQHEADDEPIEAVDQQGPEGEREHLEHLRLFPACLGHFLALAVATRRACGL
jgi:hypothetical protein